MREPERLLVEEGLPRSFFTSRSLVCLAFCFGCVTDHGKRAACRMRSRSSPAPLNLLVSTCWSALAGQHLLVSTCWSGAASVLSGAAFAEFTGRRGDERVDEGYAPAGPARLVPGPLRQPSVHVHLVGDQRLVQFGRPDLQPPLQGPRGTLLENLRVDIPAPAQFLVVVEVGLELAAGVGERAVLKVRRLEMEGVALRCGWGEFLDPLDENVEAGVGDGVGPLDAVFAARL